MSNYIVSMHGYIERSRGLGQDGFQLTVSVSFDAKQFNAIKKKSDPLAAGMAQIKNVVLDACGVRGTPGYAPVSYGKFFPRASKGLVTLRLTFDVSPSVVADLSVDVKSYSVYHAVDLQTVLEATRNDGHLFAKTALASAMGH